MKRTALALLILIACAGCGREEAPAKSAPGAADDAQAPAAIPPPPAPAGPDAERARAAALAAGPGSCEAQVPAIRVLPAKAELGHDGNFDRVAVHPQAYKACLVAMVRDRTPMQDPGPEPKRDPYAVGDLAYDLLARLGHIKYGECIPDHVLQRLQTAGPNAVTLWLADTNPRRQVHRCLGKRLGV
jgi:hypothetical protein